MGRLKGWGDSWGGATQGVGRLKGWGDSRGGVTQGVGRLKGWGDSRGGATQGVGRLKGWGDSPLIPGTSLLQVYFNTFYRCTSIDSLHTSSTAVVSSVLAI